MSVLDKFLDIMRLNDDDYEDDDYDYDNEEYDEPEPVREKESRSSRRERRESKREEKPERAAGFEVTEKQPKASSGGKITPITKNKRQGQQVGMEVCVIKPNLIEDELEIAETLLNGRTVVINMEGLSVDIAQRIIDFTCGATFAMHGNLQKISTYIFLATPNGVDISGDIQNFVEGYELPGFTL